MTTRVLAPGALDLMDLACISAKPCQLSIDPASRPQVEAARATVEAILQRGDTVYGINTGFGRLARTSIHIDQLADLQRNLILSHAAGTGPPLDDGIVRLILALKAASLARGYSGVRWQVIEALLALVNADIYPLIPAKGSVGASGDLAPLAHLSAALLGIGEVRLGTETLSAEEALRRTGLTPLELAPKEGLALLNGTQVSTALAIQGLLSLERGLGAAVLAGSLSVDAAQGSDVPFDEVIQAVRELAGQQRMAAAYRQLLAGSHVRESHRQCDRVQDPYSLRCQPQVMGACLDLMDFAAKQLLIEANAVTDNPLVFAEQNSVLSGGNFHAQPVAFAADQLALAAAEIGALSERRIALLMDTSLSGLPAFLVAQGGINSGLMLAQVTAAALVAENRHLAHPASIDSIPTSANQEDHVSMATHAARRLGEMADNLATIVAIELICAAQALEFHRPLRSSTTLECLWERIRQRVAPWDKDRWLASDIAVIKAMVQAGELDDLVPNGIFPSQQC